MDPRGKKDFRPCMASLHWCMAKVVDKPSLTDEVWNTVKPIYEDLSNNELLTYLGGFTQNNNKSLNSSVWSIASKMYSSGKIIIDIATDIVVCNFNLTVDHNCYNFCMETDARHVQAAERFMTDAVKEARKVLKTIRKL